MFVDYRQIVFKSNLKSSPEVSAYDLYKSLIDMEPNYVDFIDGAVYTKDREFRTIYSQKFGDCRILTPVNENINLTIEQQLSYLISFVKGDIHAIIVNDNDWYAKALVENIRKDFFESVSTAKLKNNKNIVTDIDVNINANTNNLANPTQNQQQSLNLN